MARKKEKFLKELERDAYIICDVCHKEFSLENDIIEVQEMHHLSFTGGYGSVFEDGQHYEIDICQNCVKEKLGAYIRKVGKD